VQNGAAEPRQKGGFSGRAAPAAAAPLDLQPPHQQDPFVAATEQAPALAPGKGSAPRSVPMQWG